MLSWLFESVLLLTIIQLVTAVTEYPCTNHRIIYEASPDYGYDSGATGYIYRYQGRYTATALCTVQFPPSAAGKTCRLKFTPGPNGYVDTSPGYSTRGQIFTLGSSNYATSTWNGRGAAYRDQQVGTFINARVGANAGWEGSNTFPCPTGPKGFEVAPTGDFAYIWWTSPAGLSVEVL